MTVILADDEDYCILRSKINIAVLKALLWTPATSSEIQAATGLSKRNVDGALLYFRKAGIVKTGAKIRTVDNRVARLHKVREEVRFQ